MRKSKLKELNLYFDLFKTREIKLSENPASFVTTKKYNVTINNGVNITREKILKNNLDGGAAIILPITDENEYLTSIEPRVFTKNTVDVGFPAGYIDSNEDPYEAAKRELLEETGYAVDEIIKLGQFYQDQGISGACNSYFIGLGAKKVQQQKLDKDEIIKYMTFTEDEIEYLIEHNYMTSLNAAYIFEKAKSYMKKQVSTKNK